MQSMARHVEAMLALKQRGAVTFDYGNNIRAQAKRAGIKNAFDIPGFVPEYVRPLFCEGKGPFRWAALSGDPEDIHVTDALALDMFADDAALVRWIRMARERVAFQGLPARICWLGYGDRARFGLKINELVRAGSDQGADRDRPRSSRHRIGRVAVPRNGRDARRQRRDRRLAGAECAAQRLGRRDMGVGPSRRRRRHRVLAARRDGDRRGRLRGGRRQSSNACSPATLASASRGTRTRGIPEAIATADLARHQDTDAPVRLNADARVVSQLNRLLQRFDRFPT